MKISAPEKNRRRRAGYFQDFTPSLRANAHRRLDRFCRSWRGDLPAWRLAIIVGQARWLALTFASRLIMAGVDLRAVQELLGHKTIGMTVRYSDLASLHTLAAVERLDTSIVAPSDTNTDTSVLVVRQTETMILQ